MDPEEEGVSFLLLLLLHFVVRGQGRGFHDEGVDVVGACAGDLDVGDLRVALREVRGAVVGVAGEFVRDSGAGVHGDEDAV